MVAKDQVEALSDIDSVLLSTVVLRIIKGREHTLISIIPTPHNKKDSLINGIVSLWTDSIIKALVIGTTIAAKRKNGFSFFPLI